MSSSSGSGSGSDSDSEPELSEEESQSSDGSSSVEEIPRPALSSRHHDVYPADVVFAEPEFEEQGDARFSPSCGYDEHDDPSLSRQRKKSRLEHKHKLAGSSRTRRRALKGSGSGSGSSDNSDSDSDSDTSRRKRRRLSYNSSVSSLLPDRESLHRKSRVDPDDEDTDDICRDDHEVVAAEVGQVVYQAEQKSLKQGVPRELKSFADARPSDVFPSMANFFCPGCKCVQQGYIVDGVVRDRSFHEINSILEHLKTKYNLRLPHECR